MNNPYESLSTDIVILKKPDGTFIENIKAKVQPEKITIYNATLLIDEGDFLIRTMSNGGVEEYEVLDRGFREQLFSINAHYQCKVRKLTVKSSEPVSQVINNFNFNAPNARYNNNSTDSSVNVVTQSSMLFEEIRKAIEKNIQDDEQQQVIIEMVNEMESSNGTPSFKDKYAGFIQALGNHITVISPFIPNLTQLL